MVHFMRSENNLWPRPETLLSGEKSPVKLETGDSLEEEEARLLKRAKTSSSPLNQQWSLGSNEFPIPPSQYNPLNEPSPLGLRLRKSPSLLELIQMRLSQGNSSADAAPSEDLKLGSKRNVRNAATSGSIDKLKASNFPASLLRIGCWEYVSRHEGDLVAKCYFAKHKLVWEVLDGGLKNKIEIQWSDIMGLKAECPDDGPGTLTIVLSKPPLFFRETNPQPRKHTLWQATADFTDGQASIHRKHYLQCAQGLLNKHYEKLIQCDTRLNLLSQQLETVLCSPYFVAEAPILKDPDELRDNGFNLLDTAKGSPVSGLQDAASSSPSQPSSSTIEELVAPAMAYQDLSKAAHSPNSATSSRVLEGNGNPEGYDLQGLKNWEQVPRLQPTMSISDLVNHIGHCISEQKSSGNLQSLDKTPDSQYNMLENIAQVLLSDTQLTTGLDEKSLMSRVNSLCCLLQDPDSASDPQLMTGLDEQSLMSRVNSLCCLLQDPDSTKVDKEKNPPDGHHSGKDVESSSARDSLPEKSAQGHAVAQEDLSGASGCKQAPSVMSRKDSYGDLLLNLPRIASLPRFLFDISEDGEISNS